MQSRLIVVRALVLFLIAICSFVSYSCNRDNAGLTPSNESKMPRDVGSETEKNSEIVVVSYGGAHQAAQREAYFEPFSKAFNCTVREETWAGDFGRFKAMVESGNVMWDVVDVEGYMVLLGARQNLLEKIDYNKINRTDLIQEGVHDYGVVTCFWSTILAYNTTYFSKTRKHPVGWREFWNVTKFPCRRALRKDPVGNLEFALLADGVPKGEIYPINVDRAFRSLDRIKDYIDVWWEAGEQPVQLLNAGEVYLSSAWNGRIYNAALNERPVAIEWDTGIISSDWWVIPRGAKNTELAQEFIAFASSAGPQSHYSKLIPYGPVNKLALKKLPPDRVKDLPTEPKNLSKQIIINNQWWLDNKGAVLERWNKWLIE